VLRSYTLLRDENDQLKAELHNEGEQHKAAQDRSAMEKSGLEAQLNVMKDALPVAAQASALHEQLRQTQDQLAALAEENHQLKTRLSLGSPAPGTALSAPSHQASPPPPPPAASVPAPAPAPRVHVVAAGETLGQISRQYYGTASRWPEILAANRDVLRNENSLTVGSKLRIP
jgi:nucleoid-associated protein YgaU